MAYLCRLCNSSDYSFTKTGNEVPAACVNFFDRYCWNRTVESAVPVTYEPIKIVEVSVADRGGSLDMKYLVTFTLGCFLLVSL